MKIFLFAGSASTRTSIAASRYYARYKVSDDVSIVTPQPKHLSGHLAGLPQVKIISDSSLNGYENVLSFLKKNEGIIKSKGRSVNWYLQQYLKFAVAWDATSPIFINDGDTIFSFKLLAFLQSNPSVLSTKENISIYNEGSKLLGLPCSDISYIANGGIFFGDELRRLHGSSSEWFIDVMSKILYSTSGVDFSEYQIHGAMMDRTLSVKKIQIYRRFDLLCNQKVCSDSQLDFEINQALLRYDAVSFELNHKRSYLKRLLAKVAYKVGYSW